MRKVISYSLVLIVIPIILLVGSIILNNKRYNIISIIVVALACVPFFAGFERKKNSSKKVTLIAVMVALSVVGRFVFAPIPGFKPVTAMVVITAIYFGPEAGFLTGALTAIISNMYFSQGPWTPFQMFVWGIIGFIAGLLSNKALLNNRILLSVYGVVAGIGFSLVMDIWTVLSIDNGFNTARYMAIVSTSVPFMVEYAISNVIFLNIIKNPMDKKFLRVKEKYGIN